MENLGFVDETVGQRYNNNIKVLANLRVTNGDNADSKGSTDTAIDKVDDTDVQVHSENNEIVTVDHSTTDLDDDVEELSCKDKYYLDDTIGSDISDGHDSDAYKENYGYDRESDIVSNDKKYKESQLDERYDNVEDEYGVNYKQDNIVETSNNKRINGNESAAHDKQVGSHETIITKNNASNYHPNGRKPYKNLCNVSVIRKDDYIILRPTDLIRQGIYFSFI